MASHDLTVEDAVSLLSGGNPINNSGASASELLNGSNISIEQAKNILQTPQVPLTVSNAKDTLLGIKSFEKNSNIENTVQVKEQNLQTTKRPSLSENGLIPTKDLDTGFGATANTILTGVSAGVDLIGGLVQSGFTALNALDKSGITQDDLNDFNELERIVESGGTPNPKQLELLNEDSISGSTLKKKSKFKQIQDFNEREKIIKAIDFGTNSVKKFLVNDTNTVIALNKLNKTNEKAAKEIFEDTGGVFNGIATFLGGVYDLATEDTAAAIELTVQSLPQMLLLARNAALGVGPLTAQEYESSLDEFRKQYKREPDDKEKAIAAALSLVSVGLDTIGAKTVLPTKKGIKLLAKKLGIKTVTKTIKRGSFKGAAKLASKPVTSTVVEGSTEGAQNVLSQLAGTQDISKVKPAKVLTDTAVGAVAGGAISGVTTSVEATAKTVSGAKNKLAKTVIKASEKAKELGIVKVDEAITIAKKNSTPKLAIEAINSLDFTSLGQKERTSKLKELNDFIIDFENKADFASATIDENSSQKDKDNATKLNSEAVEFSKKLDNLIEASLSLKNGGSIDAAINIIDKPEVDQTTKTSKEAIGEIVQDLQSSLSTSPEQVDKILGSTEFKDNASKKDKKIINDYKEYNDSLDTLETNIESNKTPELVSATTQTSSIKDFISRTQKAILLNNEKEVREVLGDLQRLRQQKTNKLANGKLVNNKKVPFKRIEANFILSEIEAYTAAIKQARNMGKAAFGNTSTPIDSSTKNDTPIKIKEYNTTNPDYNNLIIQLNDVNIIEKVEDETGRVHTLNRNVGKSLTIIDTRLNIIENIYKECG